MKFIVDLLKFLVAIVPNVIELVHSAEKRKEEKKRKEKEEKEEQDKRERQSVD